MATIARAAARRPNRLRVPDAALPWLSVLAVLLLFDALPRIGVLPENHFPPISKTLGTFAEQLTDGAFWEAVGNTLQGWALGLGIAAALAIPLGILIGSNRILYRSLRGVIEFLRPVPSVALIPLAILIYGTGIKSVVFLAAFASFWQLIVQVALRGPGRRPGGDRHRPLVRIQLPPAPVPGDAAERGALHRHRAADRLGGVADPHRHGPARDRLGGARTLDQRGPLRR